MPGLPPALMRVLVLFASLASAGLVILWLGLAGKSLTPTDQSIIKPLILAQVAVSLLALALLIYLAAALRSAQRRADASAAERERAEAAMHDSEDRDRLLFEDNPQPMWIFDLHTLVFLAVNEAALRQYGYDRAEFLAMTIADIRPEADLAPLNKYIATLKTGLSASSPWQHRRKDGAVIDVEVVSHDTMFAGRSARLVLVNDVTERRRAEAERDELLAREHAARSVAEAANQAKDEFLATLSHELRTPLNAILGWIYLLRNHRTDAVTADQALEVIERNAKGQTQLINDLLDVSRIISGRLRVGHDPVDLAIVVEMALAALRPAAEAKNLGLEMSLPSQVVIVDGDADRLQQVVLNLVTNAIKFTPESGRLEIALRCEQDQAVLRVTDSGQGISPDFLPHIFERFRQADTGITRSRGGLGLGLAIVHHLVELHGGEIVAESDGVGKGATFTLKLPLLMIGKTASSR